MSRHPSVARKVKRKHRKNTAVTAGGAEQVIPAKVRLRSAERDGLAQRKKIRAWANAHGYEQAPAGYIKRDVMAAYYAAHPKEPRP